MSVFGIVVEGVYDAAVYPVIIKRLRPDIERVDARPCGGVAGVSKKFLGFLKEFHYGYAVKKALVIRDADGKNAPDAEGRLRDILDKSRFQARFPVHFYATKTELETWLLADEDAVNQVARNRGKARSAKSINGRLEEIRDPKRQFLDMLSAADLPADNQVYEEVAAAANLETVTERCPYFAEFRERVHAC